MKSKVITVSVLFIVLSLINVWFSTCVHLILSSSFTEFTDIKYIDCIVGILSNSSQGNLFLVMELLILTLILILMFTYNSDSRHYTSKMNRITDYIETPEVAGQNQHGSARWMTENEKNELFDTIELDCEYINRLAAQGYDDLQFMKKK